MNYGGGRKFNLRAQKIIVTFYYTIKCMSWYMKYMKNIETLGKLFLAFYFPRIVYSVIYRAWSGFM